MQLTEIGLDYMLPEAVTLPTLIGCMSIVAGRQAFQSHQAPVRFPYHRPDRRALTSLDFSQMIPILGSRRVTRSLSARPLTRLRYPPTIGKAHIRPPVTL